MRAVASTVPEVVQAAPWICQSLTEQAGEETTDGADDSADDRAADAASAAGGSARGSARRGTEYGLFQSSASRNESHFVTG
jgi:hypothetical protein